MMDHDDFLWSPRGHLGGHFLALTCQTIFLGGVKRHSLGLDITWGLVVMELFLIDTWHDLTRGGII
jgi:hypothetical protein